MRRLFLHRTTAAALLAALAIALILMFPATVFAQQRPGTNAPVTACTSTITAGGSSQTAIPGNLQRRYVFMQNPIAESETLYVNIANSATTTTSYELAPGGSLTFATDFIPTDNIFVMAATTGHRYICKYGF